SGDRMGARGLLAGCVTWYSVLAGVFPRTCLEITRAARGGEPERALELSARLDPIWEQFEKFGSYRVVSAIAVEIGLMTRESLHRPVLPLAGADRERSEEHTSELQSRFDLVCRLLLEKKKSMH